MWNVWTAPLRGFWAARSAHPRVLSAEERAEELSHPVRGPSPSSVALRVPGAGCRALAKGAQPTH